MQFHNEHIIFLYFIIYIQIYSEKFTFTPQSEQKNKNLILVKINNDSEILKIKRKQKKRPLRGPDGVPNNFWGNYLCFWLV